MPLPESIPVRYTEEEAGYVTVRPVVRQTFRLTELLDMIVSVTAKDVARVRQILKSGTIVYHFYRYWWAGFDADSASLSAALSQFPNPDPSRAFSSSECAKVVFETDGPNPRQLFELDRASGSRRGIFQRRSFWDRLMQTAQDAKPAYHGYSYADRADAYLAQLTPEYSQRIAQAATSASKRVKAMLRALPSASRIVFVCPRTPSLTPSQNAAPVFPQVHK